MEFLRLLDNFNRICDGRSFYKVPIKWIFSRTFHSTQCFLSITGIHYHMATESLQNCVSVCASNDSVCVQSNAFPSGDAYPFFEYLGFNCVNNSDPYFDEYRWPDQPCYMASGEWEGQCIGFKNISSVFDCVTVNNTDIRRLCPCRDLKGGLTVYCLLTSRNVKAHRSKAKPSKDDGI